MGNGASPVDLRILNMKAFHAWGDRFCHFFIYLAGFHRVFFFFFHRLLTKFSRLKENGGSTQDLGVGTGREAQYHQVTGSWETSAACVGR